MIRFITDHPGSVGETYFQHLLFATRFGAGMVLGGLACCLHGVLPFLFPTTGSRTVLALHERLRSRRHGAPHHPVFHQSEAVSSAAAEYVI